MNSEQEGLYQAKLLAFCREMNYDAEKVKALPEFKQPDPAKKQGTSKMVKAASHDLFNYSKAPVNISLTNY